MKFGALINPQTARSETARELREGTISMAKTVDVAGFDLVMAGQHYLSDFTQFQLLPFLARLTGEIDSVELATGIIIMPFYHPIEIAEQIATIDSLHNSATIFGIGAGYRDVEFEAFDIPKRERIPRTVEGLEIVKKLLTNENVSYDGEFYSLQKATIPVIPDDPLPVWLAGNADQAVERAARLSDAWLVNPHSTIAEIEAQKRNYYDPVRGELREDMTVPIIRETFVAPTHEEAVQAAQRSLWEKYQRYVSWGQDEAMENPDDLRQPFDDLAEDRFLLGTPAEVAEEIKRYEEKLDANYIIVRSHWPGLDYEKSRKSLELLGDEVIPYV